MFACLPAGQISSLSPLSFLSLSQFPSTLLLPHLPPAQPPARCVCVCVTNNVEIKCYARGDKRRLIVVAAVAVAVEAALMQLAATPPNDRWIMRLSGI